MAQQLKLKFDKPQLKPCEQMKQLNLIVEYQRKELLELTKDLPVYIELDRESATYHGRYRLHLKSPQNNAIGCCIYDEWELKLSLDLIRTLYINNIIDFSRVRQVQGLMKFFHHHLTSHFNDRSFLKGIINRPNDFIRNYILYRECKPGVHDVYFINKMLRDRKTNTQAERIIDVLATISHDSLMNRLPHVHVFDWKYSMNFRARKEIRKRAYLDYIEYKRKMKELG